MRLSIIGTKKYRSKCRKEQEMKKKVLSMTLAVALIATATAQAKLPDDETVVKFNLTGQADDVTHSSGTAFSYQEGVQRPDDSENEAYHFEGTATANYDGSGSGMYFTGDIADQTYPTAAKITIEFSFMLKTQGTGFAIRDRRYADSDRKTNGTAETVFRVTADNSDIRTNRWYKYAVEFAPGGTTANSYLNGELYQTLSVAKGYGMQFWRIFATASKNSSFDGYLDDVRLYKTEYNADTAAYITDISGDFGLNSDSRIITCSEGATAEELRASVTHNGTGFEIYSDTNYTIASDTLDSNCFAAVTSDDGVIIYYDIIFMSEDEISSSVYNVDNSAHTISGITRGITAERLKSELNTGGVLSVVDKDGVTELANSDYVNDDMFVKLGDTAYTLSFITYVSCDFESDMPDSVEPINIEPDGSNYITDDETGSRVFAINGNSGSSGIGLKFNVTSQNSGKYVYELDYKLSRAGWINVIGNQSTHVMLSAYYNTPAKIWTETIEPTYQPELWVKYAVAVDADNKNIVAYANGDKVLDAVISEQSPNLDPFFRILLPKDQPSTALYLDNVKCYPISDMNYITPEEMTLESENYTVDFATLSYGRIKGAIGANVETVTDAFAGNAALSIVNGDKAAVSSGTVTEGMLLKAELNGIIKYFEFTDADIRVIKSNLGSDSVSIVYNAYADHKLICAEYDSSLCLSDVHITDGAAGYNSCFVDAITNPNYKCMFFNDFEDLVPLTSCLVPAEE